MSQYMNNRLNRAVHDPKYPTTSQFETPSRSVKQFRPHLQQSASNRLLTNSRSAASNKSLTPKVSSSDFFNTLQTQMHRIDENFSIEWSDDTPLQQALNCLVQAIDVIESEKIQESCGEDLRYSESPVGNDYEQRLKIREEKIAADEILLAKERNLINSEKEKVRKIKDHYLQLENELKQQKILMNQTEKENNEKIVFIKGQLEHELQGIAEQKRELDREALEMELLKSKLDEYNSSLAAARQELERESSKIFEKSLEIDKQKWQLDSQKAQLDEKEAITNHLREKIEQELKSIESERAELLKSKIDFQTLSLKHDSSDEKFSLQAEKLALAQERERLQKEEQKFTELLAQYENDHMQLIEEKKRIEKDKEFVIEEREAVDEAWDEIEGKQDSQAGGKIPEDYAEMLEELQHQMLTYNKEIEKREKDLQVKEQDVLRREEEVEKKFEEIQNVEFSLLRAKRDLEELSLGTIPELETQSQHIQSILADLLVKRNEVDSGYHQLQARILEFERTKSQSRSGNDIGRMAEELESKIRKIREREDELAELQTVLEKEKRDNLNHALMLKNAEKEFEENCAKKEEEIEASTKKLEKLQSKLQAAIQLMNTKENELISMKNQLVESRSRDKL